MDMFAPLSGMSPTILFVVRVILGVTMVYYGSFKIKGLKTNAKSFVEMGFKPGWFWGTLVALLEFVGGILIILGLFSGILAAFYGFVMLMGHFGKS